MKALFLIFHGFEEFNGISKKIIYQIKALKECGLDVKTCFLDDSNNHKKRMIDDGILKDYGNGIKGKILKRIEFSSIVDFIKENNIKFVYMRFDHNANPFTINLLRRLNKIGVKIVMEIPTYPYDQEYKGLPFVYQRIIFIDKCFRKFLAPYVYKIVTFSDYETIWGKPTIKISNGIDFSQIKIKSCINDTSKEFHLIGVATMHPWHGFDRVINGLINYYSKPHKIDVYFHIVGYGVPEVVDGYKKSVADNNLGKYIIFHSAVFGDALDYLFEKSDFGIGSLARHRSNITKIKTLKNIEYAARGIPFVYSEIDDDFENMPYIIKVSPDDSPLDIEKLISFYKSRSFIPTEIRATVENTLSWNKQMKRVLIESEINQ
jgi:glycosyltransferase involved in cell wall biosynthesis